MRRSNAVRACLISLALLSWLAGYTSALGDEPRPSSIVDTHVHLWDLSRPDGIYWISKDNKTLYQKSRMIIDFKMYLWQNFLRR